MSHGGRRSRKGFWLLVPLGLIAATASPSAGYPRPGYNEFASISTDGEPSGQPVLPSGSWNPPLPTSSAISADGRWVAFASRADNLVIDDRNPGLDMFLRDRKTGRTQLVTKSPEGLPARRDPIRYEGRDFGAPALSRNGRYLAFTSQAVNLVPGDTNTCGSVAVLAGSCADVFVFDRNKDEIVRVSVASDGTEGNGESHLPSISDNGRYVLFNSWATTLVPDDTDPQDPDLFLHDLHKQTTSLVSVPIPGDDGNPSSMCGALDATGRYAVYSSDSTFIRRDLQRDSFQPVFIPGDDPPDPLGYHVCDQNYRQFDVSSGGRFVVFSGAGRFVPTTTTTSSSPLTSSYAT